MSNKELQYILDLLASDSEDYDGNDHIIWANFIIPKLNDSIGRGLKISDMLDKGVSFLLRSVYKNIDTNTSLDLEIKNELQSTLDKYHD